MNKDKKLKVAFLGGGINSAVGKAHKSAISIDDQYELVAGCFSKDENINKLSGAEYKVSPERIYSNLEELIDSEKEVIDAIIILTPTPNHKNDVLKCLDVGLPVICEKSLATCIEEAEEIQNKILQTQGFLAVTYNYTGYPILRELRKIIQNNSLGKLKQIHIEMPQESYLKQYENKQLPKIQDWRLSDVHLPTISLDLGVHLHHIIHFLTQEKPVKLVAIENNFGFFEQIIDNVICIANYTNNLVCNIWYSKSALGYKNGLRIRVFGETGSAEWYQMEPEILNLINEHGIKSIIDRSAINVEVASENKYNRFKAGHPIGYVEAFANHYLDISESLMNYLQGDKMKPSDLVFGIQEAYEGLKMLEAMSQSAKSQKWVTL